MTHLDLFSGIGGFALAADRVWGRVEHTFCEIDPFCQAILKKHWPNAKIYGDIRTLTADTKRERNLRELGERPKAESAVSKGTARPKKPVANETRDGDPRPVDLLTGGFPCQPFSQAGQRKGTGDDRHLWPEMRRVIREFSPRLVVGENVRGLLSIDGGLVFESVCTDLEALGYEVQPFIIPACAVNAPHRRDRVWVVARSRDDITDTISQPVRGDARNLAQEKRDKQAQSKIPRKLRNPTSGEDSWPETWPSVATRLCSLDDGLPNGLVRPRGWRNAALKAAGNAIVPQVAMQIFNAIKQQELKLT